MAAWGICGGPLAVRRLRRDADATRSSFEGARARICGPRQRPLCR